MRLRDRRKLARLMVIQEVTQRELAAAAGWSSHSYLGRLLRGEANTVTPTAAIRISEFLGVPLDELFAAQMSTPTGRAVRKEKAVA